MDISLLEVNLFAAIALVHDVTVVTHNLREFDRVVGLRWEDWEGG
ncbi:PIN domain-containing protein [Prochlorothrix hollandica]|nr:hypothetical protein [Prochlorothrix hollandica]